MGAAKTREWKMRELKTRHQVARVENAVIWCHVFFSRVFSQPGSDTGGLAPIHYTVLLDRLK